MYVCMYACMHVYMYVCTYIHVCMYVYYVCTHVCTVYIGYTISIFALALPGQNIDSDGCFYYYL